MRQSRRFLCKLEEDFYNPLEKTDDYMTFNQINKSKKLNSYRTDLLLLSIVSRLSVKRVHSVPLSFPLL